MLAFDPAVPPRLDRRVDLLVQIRDRRGRYPRAPQRLRDVLDAPDRHAGQVHLDQRLLYRRLPPPVALDDRRLESLAPKLRHLQRHLAGLRLKLTLVVAGSRIPTGLRSLVTLRVAQPVRFRIKQRVQRLFDRPAHDPVQMSLNPFVVDPDHVVERSRNRGILTHAGFLLWFSWLMSQSP